jgi:hypothetical protein
MKSLRSIFPSKDDYVKGWYKETNKGGCPNDDETPLTSAYHNKFGCSVYDQPFEREQKWRSARTCASERMADMKHCIENGKCADNGHIFPIAVAYGLGKQCLEIPHTFGNPGQYKSNFRLWYNELIDGSPSTHTLFQNELGSNDPFPLEYYNINKHTTERRPSSPEKKKKSPSNMNWETVPYSKNTKSNLQNLKVKLRNADGGCKN